MIKNYLLKLLAQCSEEQFGQDAIEWAIVSGLVDLSYDLDTDVHAIMPKYDEIIEAYRHSLAQKTEEHRNLRAPMKRASPRARAETSESDTPITIKRKSAA